MYSSIQLAIKFLKYYYGAGNGKGHGVHSPFIYDFIRNVLNNNKGYEPPGEIENIRKEYLRSRERIALSEMGAGSRQDNQPEKSIARIASSALKPPRFANILYRLARHYKPQTIIELGTSLGISTAYLAMANPAASVITIEGSTAVREKALDTFSRLGISNVQSFEGNFDDVLPGVLSQHKPDLVYIDGNHRYEPTLRYFRQVLEVAHNDTILVFDDIHWSREMEMAWEEIRSDKAVTHTVDIFFLGFVFLRREVKAKQHFDIRF